MFHRGDSVAVRHGVSSWRGIVALVSPGSIIVDYPNGRHPGDSIPGREMVDLSRHSVELVESAA